MASDKDHDDYDHRMSMNKGSMFLTFFSILLTGHSLWQAKSNKLPWSRQPLTWQPLTWQPLSSTT